MKNEEAIKHLEEWKEVITSSHRKEVIDMAIEALRNEINCVKCVHYTERETDTGIKGVCKIDTAHREDLIRRSRAIKEVSEWATDILHPKNLIKEDAIGILESLPSAKSTGDLVSIQMAIEHWGRSSGNLTNNQIAELQREIESLPSAEAEDRLYIKIYADDEPSVMAEKLYQICDETQNGEVAKWLKEYFPSAEPKTGEWILMPMLPVNHRYKCSICKRHHRERYDYCPSCGARMLKEDGEEE